MRKNLVVVGYGGMGGWHAEHALNSDVVNLLGVYDSKEERREAARSHGIGVYTSLEEVLQDDRVDLVTVAIPNDVHKETVIRSLEAGKNVVCEKPVALSLKDLDEMIASARHRNVLLTTHQNRRWDVDFLAMKRLAESGEIGKVLRLESRIHGSRGIPSDWRGMKQHGGGMILDWGVHLIDQIYQIIKTDVKSVYCTTTHYTNNEVDDGCHIVITFADETEALVEVGTLNFIAMPRFYMIAEKGTALIQDWREKTRVVRCKAWHENDVRPVKTAAGLTKTMAPRDDITVDTYELERPVSDVHDFYRNVCKAIDGKAAPLITHEQMRKVMRTMELAMESAKIGQVMPF